MEASSARSGRRRSAGAALLSARAAALAAFLLAAGSCAQKGFPPGGPQDISPPYVVSVEPDSGAVQVGPGSPVTITFNEKMDRRSVEGALFITPRTDMESVEWDDAVLTMVPAGGLASDETYTLLLASGMKDLRDNATPEGVVSLFSTGDSISPGTIEGTVDIGRARTLRIMVWAFGREDCPPVFAASSPDGVAQAGRGGEFAIRGLGAAGSYCVYAHLDRDGDAQLDDEELFMGADSLVTLSRDSTSVSGITIYLVPEDEPGKIAGSVVDSAGVGADRAAAVPPPDSLLAPAPEDSARAAAVIDSLVTLSMRADSVYSASPVIVTAVDVADSSNFAQAEPGAQGGFNLEPLRPGVYKVEAFRDLNRDRILTRAEEPWAARARVVVKPGRVADVGVLILKRREVDVPNE